MPIGEHEVDAAELRDTTGDRLVDVLLGRHRVRHAVELAAPVERDDIGAFFGEPDGVGPPPDPGPRR